MACAGALCACSECRDGGERRTPAWPVEPKLRRLAKVVSGLDIKIGPTAENLFRSRRSAGLEPVEHVAQLPSRSALGELDRGGEVSALDPAPDGRLRHGNDIRHKLCQPDVCRKGICRHAPVRGDVCRPGGLGASTESGLCALDVHHGPWTFKKRFARPYGSAYKNRPSPRTSKRCLSIVNDGVWPDVS